MLRLLLRLTTGFAGRRAGRSRAPTHHQWCAPISSLLRDPHPHTQEEYGYFVADVDISTCKNSYGPGCFVDQVCAAGLSAACGLGAVFDAAHEAAARKAIAKYNVVKKPP